VLWYTWICDFIQRNVVETVHDRVADIVVNMLLRLTVYLWLIVCMFDVHISKYIIYAYNSWQLLASKFQIVIWPQLDHSGPSCAVSHNKCRKLFCIINCSSLRSTVWTVWNMQIPPVKSENRKIILPSSQSVKMCVCVYMYIYIYIYIYI